MSRSVVLELLARLVVLALTEYGRHQKDKRAEQEQPCDHHHGDPVH